MNNQSITHRIGRRHISWSAAAMTLIVTLLLLFMAYIPQAFSVQPTVLSSRIWGGTGSDAAYGIALDSSGNSYVTGYTSSFGAGTPALSHVFLLKYDRSMNLVWQRLWEGSNGSEVGLSLTTDPVGDIYVTGATTSFGAGGSDAFVLKFDPSGNILWQYTWGGSANDFGTAVSFDPFGNVYVGGSRGNITSQDIFLMKLSSSGSLLWQTSVAASCLGSPFCSLGNIAVAPSGSIYVSGNTQRFGAGGTDVFLLKFDSNGTLLWEETWGGTGGDYGAGITVDSTENIYVAGSTSSFGAGGSDALILKFNSAGALLFRKTWGGSMGDAGYSIAISATGKLYVAGVTNSFGAGLEGAFLLSLDSSGNLLSQNTWGGSGSNNDIATGVAVDGSGDAHVTGYVSEAPPYGLGLGNNTMGTPSFGASQFNNGTSAVATPLVASSGIVFTTLSGSTSYSGSQDVFTFVYGLPSPPSPPAALSAKAGVGSVFLTWSPPSSSGGAPITGYNLYRSTSTNSERLYLYAVNLTAFTDRFVTGGVTYYYQVSAVNSAGESAHSDEVSATPLAVPTIPPPPQGFTAYAAVNQIDLSWSPPSANGGSPITDYRVYRGTYSGGETFLSNTNNQTAYIDSSVNPGSTYYYTVTAINAAGESYASNEVITTPSSPFPWQYFAAAAGVGVVCVTGVTYIVRPPLPHPDNIEFHVEVKVHSEPLREESDK